MFSRYLFSRRMGSSRQRVLAVASGGGHWVQLQRLMGAMEGHEVAFVTTLDSYREELGDATRFYSVRDANRWNKFGLIRMAIHLTLVMLREKPDIVISTGAAAGYFCIRLAKLMGAKTIWVDSLANADHLSLCGERIGRYADLWLTQWPHLARPEGPFYRGAVI